MVIHGVKRDADRYYEYVTDLLERNPERARDTGAGAAFFRFHRFRFRRHGGVAQGQLGRRRGQRAGRRRPAPVSSFQVLDDLLRSLDDRQRLPRWPASCWPAIPAARLVQRYAVLNNVDGPLRRDGLALRYVIANPSSYLYLTNERPRPDGKGYAPYERGICPTYNQYSSGTDKLPAPRARPGGIRLFATRRATSLPAGGADNNPEHRLLGPAAPKPRAPRGWRAAPPPAIRRVPARAAAASRSRCTAGYEVRGVGHDGKNMFGSECGAQALLGEGARGTDKAAPCEPIKRAASSARQAPSGRPPIA